MGAPSNSFHGWRTLCSYAKHATAASAVDWTWMIDLILAKNVHLLAIPDFIRNFVNDDDRNCQNCSTLILHHRFQSYFKGEQVWIMSSLMNLKGLRVIMTFSNNECKFVQSVHTTLKSLQFIKFDINQTCSLLRSMVQYCRTVFAILSVVFSVKHDIQIKFG